MRLKKGTKVEVLNKEEGSIGAWRSAEIISGNGRNYYIKYNPYSGSNEFKVERVPRKAIRPCPPAVQGVDCWASGDIVEVYHSQLWKTAVIMKVNGKNSYTVRLLGYAEELSSHSLQLRVRQVWDDDRWFVLAKDIQSWSTERKRLPREKLHVLNSCLSGEQNNQVSIPYVLSKETMKRKPPILAHQMWPQKRRMIEKGVSDLQFHIENPLGFVKVDATKKSSGNNNLHSSSRDGRTGLIEVDVGRSIASLHYRTSMTIDADSCTSSVGSCSTNNSDLACGFINYRDTENADESSDAESFCGNEHNESASLQNGKENSLARSHSSELHAYSRAVEALFASGPFSWEEETNMSNFRKSLHISDDEHLTLMMVPKQISWPWSEIHCLFPKALRLWGWILELVHLIR